MPPKLRSINPDYNRPLRIIGPGSSVPNQPENNEESDSESKDEEDAPPFQPPQVQSAQVPSPFDRIDTQATQYDDDVDEDDQRPQRRVVSTSSSVRSPNHATELRREFQTTSSSSSVLSVNPATELSSDFEFAQRDDDVSLSASQESTLTEHGPEQRPGDMARQPEDSEEEIIFETAQEKRQRELLEARRKQEEEEEEEIRQLEEEEEARRKQEGEEQIARMTYAHEDYMLEEEDRRVEQEEEERRNQEEEKRKKQEEEKRKQETAKWRRGQVGGSRKMAMDLTSDDEGEENTANDVTSASSTTTTSSSVPISSNKARFRPPPATSSSTMTTSILGLVPPATTTSSSSATTTSTSVPFSYTQALNDDDDDYDDVNDNKQPSENSGPGLFYDTDNDNYSSEPEEAQEPELEQERKQNEDPVEINSAQYPPGSAEHNEIVEAADVVLHLSKTRFKPPITGLLDDARDFTIIYADEEITCTRCTLPIKRGDTHHLHKCKMVGSKQDVLCSSCQGLYNTLTAPGPEEIMMNQEHRERAIRRYGDDPGYEGTPCNFCSAAYRWLVYMNSGKAEHCQLCVRKLPFWDLRIYKGTDCCIPNNEHINSEEKAELVKRHHIICTECYSTVILPKITSSRGANYQCLICQERPVRDMNTLFIGSSQPRSVNCTLLINTWYIRYHNKGQQPITVYRECANCKESRCDVNAINLYGYNNCYVCTSAGTQNYKHVVCKFCSDIIKEERSDMSNLHSSN